MCTRVRKMLHIMQLGIFDEFCSPLRDSSKTKFGPGALDSVAHPVAFAISFDISRVTLNCSSTTAMFLESALSSLQN